MSETIKYGDLEVRVHPAAELFPMMTDEELDELAADIEQTGLRQPVVMLLTAEGPQLLDGRNRLAPIARIADERRREELQRGLREIIPGDTNPVAYVVSTNLRRRHLTAEQKREIVAALLKDDPERSDNATAAIAKVDHKTVASVRAEAEGRGEIPNVEKRVDSKGRHQPAKRAPKRTAEPVPPVAPAAEPEPLVEPLAPSVPPLAAAKAAVEALEVDDFAAFKTWFIEYIGASSPAADAAPVTKRGRGRPKGSRNKPKPAPAC